MIRFLTTARNAHPIQWYLATYGARLADRLVPDTYDAVLDVPDPPLGTWCFADVDLLTDAERERAAALWRRLADRGCRLLNHPTGSLRRFELLRMLHARGTNRFAVHRPGDDPARMRFPVFVRRADDHAGSRSPLLPDAEALDAALEGLRAAGDPLEDAMVVEFCDTADARGIHRKYGAFVVGERVLARHLFFSASWQVKDWDLLGPARAREERRYVRTNPHATELAEIFAAARIEYGRIDYGLVDGRIQVWEINTNPVIAGTRHGGPIRRGFTRLPSRLRRAVAPLITPAMRRAVVHARFAEELEMVWRALDVPA